MTIHLYALCWNEERMIPHFYRHYEPFVNHFFIYDDHSTDRSVDILNSLPKVTLNHIHIIKDGKVHFQSSTEFSFHYFYNDIWKQSIGKADYVILCNMDEFFFHTHMLEYLKNCCEEGVTIIPSRGYDMVSLRFPKTEQLLTQLIKKGTRRVDFDKTFAFNPNQIRDSGFLGGRHQMLPQGHIVFPKAIKVKLLHYKYLGLMKFAFRVRAKGRRIKNVYGNPVQSFIIFVYKLFTSKKII